MATPCRVAFFVMRQRKSYPRTGGGLTPPRDHTTALATNPRQPQHLPAREGLTPPRDHTTALASNPQFCSSVKKYCEKCCSFKKNSYFCSLKANRKIVKMRCKTTHFLMLAPAVAWVGIFTS